MAEGLRKKLLFGIVVIVNQAGGNIETLCHVGNTGACETSLNHDRTGRFENLGTSFFDCLLLHRLETLLARIGEPAYAAAIIPGR